MNKSGMKSMLEMNNVKFPISAWDIKSVEEFYSSLSHLIAVYPMIRIWIFKSNFDKNGITVAYFDSDKIDFIYKLKQEKKNNKNFSVELFQEQIYYQIKKVIANNAIFIYPNFYKNWNDYLATFLENSGVIEACPTKSLDGIMGNPCIPILIEPNGKINILPSYEQINVEFFKNAICTSPQNCIDNNELVDISEKIGSFLYNQEIIGYVTIKYVTFHDTKKILYWCYDIIYGLTQVISDIQFGYFLYINAKLKNKNNNIFLRSKDNNETINSNEQNLNNILNFIDENDYKKLLNSSMVFSIPFISSSLIKNIKLKVFFRDYRFENIVFDIEKKEGVIFNLCDGLECGIFGLCGVIKHDYTDRISPNLKIWKLIDKSMNVLKNIIYKNNKNIFINNIIKKVLDKDKNDSIDLQIIFNKVKHIIKEKEIEQQKEENRRKKIANATYL